MKIHDDLARLGACDEARLWAADKDADTIWATCQRTDWMIWWIGAAKPDDYERDLRLIAADIAESVLPHYERDYPGDDRPRKAIAAARDYAHGRIGDAAMAAAKTAAWTAAWAAAKTAAKTAAGAAARAAAWAAAWAAARDAAWDAAWAAAKTAAWAAACAAARDAARDAASDAAWDAAWDAHRDIIYKYYPTMPVAAEGGE